MLADTSALTNVESANDVVYPLRPSNAPTTAKPSPKPPSSANGSWGSKMSTGRPVATKLSQLWQRGTAAAAARSMPNKQRSLIKKLAEGKPVSKPDLVNIIKDLRKDCKYEYALQSYACIDDVERTERVYHKMLGNYASLCDWTTYSTLASLYVKAGLTEKAESALKKLESVVEPKEREAYHHLITLYAGLNNLGEVQRVWASLKAAYLINNSSYVAMLSSLHRLKDFEGLRKVFEESV
ncbi:hypothetical protein CRG98_045698 [Punica granatum]|uniref:Uncharacterized protein n=1 Tax=Punica granatum TaxID=22663 RepID=A0A2I0HRN0_PUNGR|nr:hypothetical protein CRG98_045698 [Punica granatum]